MGKTVKLDIRTEATTAGYLSGVGFVLLPVIEAFVFMNSMPTRPYETTSQGGMVVLAILGLLHAATIPGMIFGRTLNGTISIVDQPDARPPKSD